MTDKTLGAYQRHEKAITDRGGDVLTLSTGHPSARTDEVTVHIREHFRGRTHSAAVHVSPRELRAALDEFAPVLECPDPEQHDDRYISPLAVKRVKEVQARAEKAERERDEARDAASAALAAWEARERFRTAEPRPLTADDITDEMVDRAREEFFGGNVDGPVIGPSSARRWRAALTAALTEPPARPEGAEEWEDGLNAALPHESMPDEDIARLADQIAARAARRAEQ